MSSVPDLPIRRTQLTLLLGSLCLTLGMWTLGRYATGGFATEKQGDLDPAAWGSDHVGEDLPEFATGGECLFCHRDIGGTWVENPHNRTMHEPADDEPALAMLKGTAPEAAKDVTVLLGSGEHVRFLKSSKDYGKVDMLAAHWLDGNGETPARLDDAQVTWDQEKFASSCAGCHASGTDGKTHAFFSASLDCYTCHGDVPSEHTNDRSLALLTKKAKDDPKVITSICASCHIRTGRSRSTGLPYPNQFVPGDNLFRDFEVDLSDGAIGKLDPGDRHIQENVRDVVLRGKNETTCLSCHEVHRESSVRHQRLVADGSCVTCHEPGEPFDSPIKYVNHAKVCEY